MVTSYPPRECGIATYSNDLKIALDKKFSQSLSVTICALETDDEKFEYPEEVIYKLDTSVKEEFKDIAGKINSNDEIKIVHIQHEFGFFREQEKAFTDFLEEISKPILITFHTVLPHPGNDMKSLVEKIADCATSIMVMTHISADILCADYGVEANKITVIAHGTHLVSHMSNKHLKEKYYLKGRRILTTFGLLGSGKGIKTSLEALPSIIKKFPDVLFLIIGKTHPGVIKTEGEKYRDMLVQTITEKGLENNVRFINRYLPLNELLEYLQLSDIYLFTSNDPNQAVSGTFAYAMSCACPIISTPIPHAKEILTKDTGIIFDFNNSLQLSDAVIKLLGDDSLRNQMSINTIQKIAFTAWENSAVEHAMLYAKIYASIIPLKYNLPPINFKHLENLTTQTGIVQFSRINHPDFKTGFTLDDNARALIVYSMNLENNSDVSTILLIRRYLGFIEHCQQTDGSFLNYTNSFNGFTEQNNSENLEDSNGRAIWALGYLISLKKILPEDIYDRAVKIMEISLPKIESLYSSRAMGFAVKGLYYYNQSVTSSKTVETIKILTNRLVQMFRHESETEWKWFESYLTYANSILPEALLYAWIITEDPVYKDIAQSSFEFLLSKIFNENGIEVISNKKWHIKGEETGKFGEQPIDVAYTISTLSMFHNVFQNNDYKHKMTIAFEWFLGHNRLNQIIYNPCTGGCYDGLEENNINLNQGAESTLSYQMARLTMEKTTDLLPKYI